MINEEEQVIDQARTLYSRGAGSYKWSTSKVKCERKSGSGVSVATIASSSSKCKNYDNCGYTGSCPSSTSYKYKWLDKKNSD